MKILLHTLYLIMVTWLVMLLYGPLVGLVNEAQASQMPLESNFDIRPIHYPWEKESGSKLDPELEKPFVLPTFEGQEVHFQVPLPPLVLAPKVDSEAIFNAVINCYPEPSKFNLEVDLESKLQNRGMFDVTGSELGRYYIAVVARMPLYSSTELNREREREYLRRTSTAETIGQLMSALAARNHAIREIGLFSAMEARSQARVAEGLVVAEEQVGYLDKVAKAQEDFIVAESSLVQYRISLMAQCSKDKAKLLNRYLLSLINPDTKVRGP